MKKNNKELTYTPQEVQLTKLSKKNYITIIIPIVLILIIIAVIALIVIKTSNPSTKVEKYLNDIGYKCSDKSCVTEEKGVRKTYNYKTHALLVETDEYRLTVSKETPVLEVIKSEQVCSYIKSDYKIFTKVDTSFMYDKNCEKYIKNINESIDLYENIITSSNADVNKIEK